jgi:hypothetical protein
MQLELLNGKLNKTPYKALMGSGKVSINKPSIVSEQRNFVKCPNTSTDSYLLNNKTGATLPIGCGRWDCPVCGEKKLWRLKKGIYNFIKNWKYIRHMTLSLSSNCSDSKEDHYKLLQECWRRFINELRRTKSLRADQRRFQYIRVPEEHKSGYMHMHVIIDSFLDVKQLFPIWQHIIHEASHDPFLGGSVVITLLPTAKDGARYITKYVSKLLTTQNFLVRKYSKSKEVVIFVKNISTGEWSFCFGIRPLNESEAYDDVLNFFTCQINELTSQRNVSENDLGPPNFAPDRPNLPTQMSDEEYWQFIDKKDFNTSGFLNPKTLSN